MEATPSSRYLAPRRRPGSTVVRHATVALAAVLLGSCAAPGEEASVTFPESWRYSADVEPVTARNGMVVTTDAYATQVGLDVLQDGGNAVDAAVAVQFALAVVNPEAGNIGGGGFLVLRTAEGENVALDYREKAPLAATRDMFLDEEGNLTDRSVVGHLASGVPGTVEGMWQAHRRYGSLPWGDLVQPAVELAEGFEVGDRFHRFLSPEMVESLTTFPAAAAAMLPREGEPPAVGDTLRQPDLADTMRRIRDGGPEGFYLGRTADLIVEEMERGGGIITHEDLESYDAVWRDPLTFEYRGHTIVSMPPTSSGGATMAEAANILEQWDLSAMPWHSVDMIHLFAEAWKRAYADRNHYLADPDFVEMPLSRMTSRAYGLERSATISMERATPSAEVEPGLGPVPEEGENTTHYSIVDAEGNAISVTTTINSLFGSKVMVSGAGFFLNNEMDDFVAKPGAPNQWGLIEGEANAVEPEKRMLSSMTPTLVLSPDGGLRMITGSPGGSTIITTTFQTISNVIDYGMNVAQAVHAPRVHHQHFPDQIYHEPDGLPAEVVAALEARGHTVVERTAMLGDAKVIVVEDGVLTGWSDPRRGGTAMGY